MAATLLQRQVPLTTCALTSSLSLLSCSFSDSLLSLFCFFSLSSLLDEECSRMHPTTLMYVVQCTLSKPSAMRSALCAVLTSWVQGAEVESANHFGVTALMEAASSLRSKAVAVRLTCY